MRSCTLPCCYCACAPDSCFAARRGSPCASAWHLPRSSESTVALTPFPHPLPHPTPGWDARELGLPGEWADISQPRGAGETITYGVATGVLARQFFTTDGLAQLDPSPCAGAGCGFVATLSREGALEPGSSGSAMLDSASRRALGVLSTGGGRACDFDPASADPPMNNFGRLAAVREEREGQGGGCQWTCGQGTCRRRGIALSD